ncbi:MAG TPA: MBL fold metallo-hydrolase [Candidatus Eisenbacteria bacterium]|nr:MBL fold metallo-hydrolase [Candidatus Eisenbacteria bacterium]
MKLRVLGCGDAFGSGGRNQSGYLIEAADRLFLLDCGPTTLLAMKRAGIDSKRLDAVLLSHLHGDHFGGLPFFFIEFLYNARRARPFHVAGPPGTEERAYGLFQLMYGSATEPKELPPTVFHEFEPGQTTAVAGIEVLPFRVPHQTHDVSLGLKVSYERKTIVFSGDTGWTDDLVAHARGADLFLCECSFYTRTAPNHISYRELSARLGRLECKRLLLTHMGEEMLAHRRELAVETAADGMVVEL